MTCYFKHQKFISLFVTLFLIFCIGCGKQEEKQQVFQNNDKYKSLNNINNNIDKIVTNKIQTLSDFNVIKETKDFNFLINNVNSTNLISKLKLDKLSVKARIIYARKIYKDAKKAYAQGDSLLCGNIYDYLLSNNLLEILNINEAVSLSSLRTSVAINHDDFNIAEKVLDKILPMVIKSGNDIDQHIFYSDYGYLRRAQGRLEEAKIMFEKQAQKCSNNPRAAQSVRYSLATLINPYEKPEAAKISLRKFLGNANPRWDTYKLAIQNLTFIESKQEIDNIWIEYAKKSGLNEKQKPSKEVKIKMENEYKRIYEKNLNKFREEFSKIN